MCGWAHPDLIRLLRYDRISLFIDGTFRCVPKPFSQLLVIMVYDAGNCCYFFFIRQGIVIRFFFFFCSNISGTDMYVPVFYILLQSKHEWAYTEAFNEVKSALRTNGQSNLNPANIHCDFEKGLMNALADQFPDARVVGCLFHFKQALLRKMRFAFFFFLFDVNFFFVGYFFHFFLH